MIRFMVDDDIFGVKIRGVKTYALTNYTFGNILALMLNWSHFVVGTSWDRNP